jgi:transcriptional regulator with XRE-family HTH domain
MIEIDYKKLAITRAKKKMTLLELEEKSSVGHSTISRIEKGEVTPRLDTVAKLAEGLGEPLESFLI